MKYINLLFVLLSAPLAGAQVCAPASQEMSQYFAQSDWRSVSVSDEGVAPVHGYVDRENNFFFANLSRGGAGLTTVAVDSSNLSYRDFFKYCRAGKTNYLRSMRRSNEGNRYKVSVRYLPALKGFANDPLVTQKYRASRAQILVKFGPGSSIDASDSFSERARTDLIRSLNQQLPKNSRPGSFELDLSGWDDVVCDLIQGRTEIWLDSEGLSDGPLVVQKKEVEPADIRTIYSTLKEQMDRPFEKERALFAAGHAIGKLEQDRRIGEWGEKKGFDLLKKMMTPDLSRLSDLNEDAVSCLANQLQSYSRPLVQNVFHIQVKTPSLDEIEAPSAVEKK